MKTMTMWLLTSAFLLGLGGTALAAAPKFESVDGNHDGKLSTQEAASVEGLDFAKADVNKDGTVDRSEYQAAMAKSGEEKTQLK